MKRIAISALIILTACGTPQERCINTVTRDLRILDRLIAEAEGNIARGYTYITNTVYRTQWVYCGLPSPLINGQPPLPPPMCLDNVPQTIHRVVAIDRQAEAQKLKDLKTKRFATGRAVTTPIAECKARHPE